MSLRRALVAVLWLPVLAGAAPAGEARPPARLPAILGATEVFQLDSATGLALGGLDPVSYFLPGGPRAGRPEFELLWSGAAWRFASLANLAAFRADPESFAPRLGGYDAEAAARGRVVDADPLRYVVKDTRLYLFRTGTGRTRFSQDRTLAGDAEAHWPALRAELVQP